MIPRNIKELQSDQYYRLLYDESMLPSYRKFLKVKIAVSYSRESDLKWRKTLHWANFNGVVIITKNEEFWVIAVKKDNFKIHASSLYNSF